MYTIRIEKGSSPYVLPDYEHAKLHSTSGVDISMQAVSGGYEGSFVLTHGDSFTFTNIPYGAKVIVKETNPGSYGYSMIVTGAAYTENGAEVTVDALNKHTTIAYTNHLETSTPTGIYDSPAPALWMAALAMQLLCTVVLMERRKKRHE